MNPVSPARMKRVLVIGCGGAGKTRLARRLGEFLGLPVHHLDRLFWKPGWEPSTDEEIRRAIEQIFETDRWIMDGNYSGTMEMRMARADTIIFLDLPTLACLCGVIARYLTYRDRTRPDMTEGNIERLGFDFLAWILTYRRRRRPKVLSLLNRHSHDRTIITLQSRRAVDSFIDELRAEHRAAGSEASGG